MMQLPYEEAIIQGVKFRLETTVDSIDPKHGTIKTGSGETVQADVIIGADGIAGLTRRILLREDRK
jgi:salicylate hydroxylase